MRFGWLLVAGCVVEPADLPEPVDPAAAARESWCHIDAEAVEARIDALIPALTLEEKAGMMRGALALPKDRLWEVTGLPEHGIPGFHMIDGPRGISRWAEVTATAFPVGIARGATWDPQLERRVGVAMGIEARSVGADVLLAPTINVLRHPRWGRSQETYGEDPHHLGAMGTAFVQGVQEHVLASVKHFAANSIENTRFTVSVEMEERTLREVYLPHFRRVVQDGRVGSVMSAYNRLNGLYCAEDPHLLTEILKEEWSFPGFVESDWIFGTHSTVPSALAGLDLEMPAPRFYGDEMVRAVERGQLDESIVDGAVRRLLRAQFCFELDTDPPVRDPSKRETPEHLALAREVAARSMVLLHNEGGLPLSGAGTVALVGSLAELENIGDHGSSDVIPTDVVTVREGLEGRVDLTVVAHDVLTIEDEAAIAAADVAIVVVGLTADSEGEGALTNGDRDDLDLPAEHLALVEAVAALHDHVVVVLEGGGAIMVPWIDQVEAVVMAWYPGSEGGHALADVLLGAVNPSGRLPFAVPAIESELVTFDNTSDAVSYGYLHGYRQLMAEGAEVALPFGFGLSYTEFSLSDLLLTHDGDALIVSVTVTNTGGFAGIHTVQAYVSVDGATIRAPIDLRAFEQVELEPGASASVELVIPVDDLRIWDAGWTLEPATYTVHVGASSADLPLSEPVELP